MQFSIWLPILSLLLGGVLHSLTDDGGSNLLTHFGITWKIPSAVLPITILLLSIASGWSTAVQGGTPWQQALAASVATALSGLFGAVAIHATVNKTPPSEEKKDEGPKPSAKPIGLAGAVASGLFVFMLIASVLGIFASFISGCTSFGQAAGNSCAVIHVADETCESVEIPGEDGGTTFVMLTADERREFAKEKLIEQKSAAKKDAGK